jgi:anti-sigma B factor antagonist
MIPDGLPRLSVRDVDGLAVVDFVHAEVLFEDGLIRELGKQLHRLIEEGHTRLLLNLEGIRYMSGGMLATLVGLHQRVERTQGRLGLFGLDPVLRDMVRICHLERVFHIYADEREALSGGLAADDRRRLE